APVIARAWFDAQVVIEIAQMNRSGLAESHLCRYVSVAITDALTMLLQKFRESSLCHAQMLCLERTPNLFAASESSGIIAPRFMPNEILMPRSLPGRAIFLLFHSLTVE